MLPKRAATATIGSLAATTFFRGTKGFSEDIHRDSII
jgi:hypothetical protein